MEMNEQIKRERERQKLTRYKVAKMMGTSQSYYDSIEKHGVSPSLDMLKRVCEALNISVTIHPDKSTKVKQVKK
jgi:transcriptional regulator with XRE-family HTH domain